MKIRQIILPGIILIVIVVLSLIITYNKIAITQDHLFWLFSTIVQGFIALVALLGMVGVFRLQLINNKMDKMADSIRDDMAYYKGTATRCYTTEEVLKVGKELISKEGESKVPYINKVSSDLQSLFNEEKKIKKEVVNFVVYTLILVFIALFSLTFTPLIIGYSLEISVLTVMIIISSYSLCLTIRLVKSILS